MATEMAISHQETLRDSPGISYLGRGKKGRITNLWPVRIGDGRHRGLVVRRIVFYPLAGVEFYPPGGDQLHVFDIIIVLEKF